MAEENGSTGRATVALCITGSIAAYKAAIVARLLVKQGVTVLPVMTASATRFVGPPTLEGICGQSVALDMWSSPSGGELHVELARRVQAVVIVPATADLLARLAHGRADDLVTALALCAAGPVFAAPAMHPRMWLHPATQRNVAELSAQGRVELLGPVEGEVASGDVGPGRMVEPAQIAEAVMASLAPADLEGLRLVVTAGPTIEDLDPVRFISNRSTGKMGFAVAERAAARGARVTLIAGPVALPTPARVERIDVRSALAMGDALRKELGEGGLPVDVVVMAAAVADYRPATPSPGKIKKDGQRIAIEFVQNPDLLAEIGAARRGKRPVIVGFAVETEPEEALVRAAKAKRDAKGADLMVANRAADAFAGDDNRATLVSKDAVETLPRMSKRALSDVILDRVRVLWQSGLR